MKMGSAVAIICLGQGLLPDKSMTDNLLGRLRGAIDLYLTIFSLRKSSEDSTLKLILSGGDAKRTGKSEAQAMLEYISMNTNISSNYVILEEYSTNTLENMLYCCPLLESMQCKSVHIVTSEYHLPRTMLCAKAILPRSIQCFGYPAKSAHKRKENYRQLQSRPERPDQWHLCEILDWELNGVKTMNNVLMKRGIKPLHASDINNAVREIEALNKTLGLPS